MSQILSFDVGIKNLAYCLLTSKINICDWNVINLIGDSSLDCSCINKNNNKCNSKAQFYDVQGGDKIGFCKKHTQDGFHPIKTKKVKAHSVNEISELLYNTLDTYPDMLKADIVLIENQPCLMNPMIKTVQILLYSYFVIKGKLNSESNISNVKFINAKNKLSFYDGPELPIYSKNKYTQRKKESIDVCKYCISETDHGDFFMSHKKKDDLADAYLQAIWFINSLK